LLLAPNPLTRNTITILSDQSLNIPKPQEQKPTKEIKTEPSKKNVLIPIVKEDRMSVALSSSSNTLLMDQKKAVLKAYNNPKDFWKNINQYKLVEESKKVSPPKTGKAIVYVSHILRNSRT
jgi:hypothetical protein